jgi:sulfur carrier protein ThiS
MAMNIKIEFIGFPVIYDLFPEGPHSYTLPGDTLSQLIENLVAHSDPRVKESLLDPGTKSLDPTIQIMVNRKLVSKDQIQEQKVREGDQVTFMKLLAGG